MLLPLAHQDYRYPQLIESMLGIGDNPRAGTCFVHHIVARALGDVCVPNGRSHRPRPVHRLRAQSCKMSLMISFFLSRYSIL